MSENKAAQQLFEYKHQQNVNIIFFIPYILTYL
jgi:hypothetical protein